VNVAPESVASGPSIAGMVEYYLPLLVTAGDFAREIQPRVAGPGRKSGPNAWTQAITDADHQVQSFLEVATLARFPGVGFYGEEQEQSVNARYFPPDATTMVWLDPVNGTFLYQNQRPGWDIILSITRDSHLMAAMSYMPAKGRFYIAVRGRGAFTGDRDCRTLAGMEPLVTRAGSGVCLTYRAPELLAKLRVGFECFDIVEDYDPERAYDNLNDLFTGRLDAFACHDGDLLDWGAIAFIVASAGGQVSAPDGSPLDIFENFTLRSTDMLVSASPAIHARALAALAA
jgi:myo-inositol-1(or 4)-monophosphatase